MDIGKFIVGVLTIAIGLWAAGQLAPKVVQFGKMASITSKDAQNFSLRKWNLKLKSN